MNREQITNGVGALAGVALVLMLAYGYVNQQPVTDRTLAIFAVLLWGTLQLDISAAIPFSFVTVERDDEGGE
ncbi:hypothetical protein [Halococcus sp. PRR34]|uniref:hypothetical protein n=1 Tax=Halococcus sp. PRR34 TaxID=3020830 RepID=UPI00235F9C24|nr:hypothetical protein [Halococcus sp. PRR34]